MNNPRTIVAILFTLFVVASGCGDPPIKADLTTPEGAILSIEEAYRNKDIERAVACKDFKIEAHDMMRKTRKEFADDSKIVDELANVLELAYRAEMKKGFPDFNGVTSSFLDKKELGDGKVVVTEFCTYPDGSTSTQKLLVVKTATGCKVLQPLN